MNGFDKGIRLPNPIRRYECKKGFDSKFLFECLRLAPFDADAYAMQIVKYRELT